MIPISNGVLLISEPFLKDPNFTRSVIVLCEHQQEGSFGLVINRLLPLELSQLVDDLPMADFPVYYGGPVQKDTLHILHRSPDLIQGSHPLQKNLYWGGDFETICELIKTNRLSQEDIRFYLGYSGWGEGMLENEIKENTWVTGESHEALIFHPHPESCWKDALSQLGDPYRQMADYPIDPQLN